MKRHLKYLFALVAFLICSAPRVWAQEDYRFDMGGGVGMTGYLGDANTANLLAHPGWDAQIVFRYIINPRMGLKTGLYAGSLSGDSSDMSDVFPGGANYKFSTSFYELSELFEFNFLNYGIGESYRKLKRWTPYITAGLGLTVWTTDGYTGAAFTLPVGAGVKFKINKRLNLGLECLMKKTFTDKLDSEALADPHAIKSSFLKNTDWYSTFTFTLTYEFSKRCAVCNYKD
ncbi:MAG: porin family protein [Bacteroides sp.]|nr:porin family protein [Bacteroides sp.]